jgi:hypothetical protein
VELRWKQYGLQLALFQLIAAKPVRSFNTNRAGDVVTDAGLSTTRCKVLVSGLVLRSHAADCLVSFLGGRCVYAFL